MDESCEIWELLHDGSIEAVVRVGNDLRIEVGISYLADLLQPGSESIWLHLHECHLFEFCDWTGGKVTRELDRFDALELEILGLDSKASPYRITTSTGDLTADYTGCSLALADGTPVPLQQLREAVARYWDNFDKSR